MAHSPLKRTVNVDHSAGTDDLRARAKVYNFPTDTIIIKTLADGPIKGLKKKTRNEDTIDIKHAMLAKRLGVEFQGYRQKGDSGHNLYKKEPGVRLGAGFLHDLRKNGFGFDEAHWQYLRGKGPANYIVFKRGVKWGPIPNAVWEKLADCRFNNATVWCNLNVAIDKEGKEIMDGKDLLVERVDTINLAKGRKTDESARRLVMEGRTYRLK